MAKRKFFLFPCHKIRPDQAGFFRRFFAFTVDSIIIVILAFMDLKGKPRFSWYQSFERAHGYAASALIASLGFIQVLWDAEGLTMHDSYQTSAGEKGALQTPP